MTKAKDPIRELIESGRWKPIEEAPKDSNEVLLHLDDDECVIGAFVEATLDYPDEMGHDAGWISNCGLCYPGRSFGNPDYFREQEYPPKYFRPLPDNRLSDALEVAVEALRTDMLEWMANDDADYSAEQLREMARKELSSRKKALTEIKSIAEREDD